MCCDSTFAHRAINIVNRCWSMDLTTISWGIVATASLEGCTHRLGDVGNRVHTRNDSDEDVRGNACNYAIAWRALPWSFHYSNILSAVNTSYSFSWAPALVVFVVLKPQPTLSCLQLRKQQIQPIQLIQLQIVFRL